MTSIDKVLVANRGEIARRIIRTLGEMGIASVAVYSDADADAPHVREADEAVRIGPAPSSESYLAIDGILAAARATAADAIHPGYGFLAENAEFARRTIDAGLCFIGPGVEAIAKMGSKIEAKALMTEAGVPVIPGFSAIGLDDRTIVSRAADVGYPVLVKASAGGGGKGMRVVEDPAQLPDALEAARREAAGAFGDDTLLIERYVSAPRHVEIQILGDAHGRVVHCFERECSIQRRHQKVIEEAPSPAVDVNLRRQMGAAAVTAGRTIGYRGAGTVEFILDANGAFFFLEINTRLQVEHPVTEEITGLDLVRLQIEIARGEALPFGQDDLAIDGHAFEARLYAEDPTNDFLPSTGRVTLWRESAGPGLRIDSGIETGSEIGVHYDPMLAKVIAHGRTREEARRRLVRGLRGLAIGGVRTNRDFLVAILEHEAFRAGKLDTHFIARHMTVDSTLQAEDHEARELQAVAAALYLHECRRSRGGPLPSSIPSGWRNNRWRPQERKFRRGDETIEVRYVAGDARTFDVEVLRSADESEPPSAGRRIAARIADWNATSITVETDSIRRTFDVARHDDDVFVHGIESDARFSCLPRFPDTGADTTAGGCAAPMTGVIQKVAVAVGDRVDAGAVLLILEAMKMEHKLTAHADGVVTEIRVEEGQMVDPDEVLIVVEADPAKEA